MQNTKVSLFEALVKLNMKKNAYLFVAVTRCFVTCRGRGLTAFLHRGALLAILGHHFRLTQLHRHVGAQHVRREGIQIGQFGTFQLRNGTAAALWIGIHQGAGQVNVEAGSEVARIARAGLTCSADRGGQMLVVRIHRVIFVANTTAAGAQRQCCGAVTLGVLHGALKAGMSTARLAATAAGAKERRGHSFHVDWRGRERHREGTATGRRGRLQGLLGQANAVRVRNLGILGDAWRKDRKI